MATLKYKTPEGEWKKVSIGGGGSTEEVYVGSDAPTDENVKVWIDPTGTPSSPSQPSMGGSNVFVFPQEALRSGYTEESPYFFTPEKTAEFLAALENPSSVYVAYDNRDGKITSMPFTISWNSPSFITAVCVIYMMQYLLAYNLHLVMVGDTLSVYMEVINKQL